MSFLKSWFFEIMNKINKFLARLIGGMKREYMNYEHQNETDGITAVFIDTKKIIEYYIINVYMNIFMTIFNNLNE